MIKVSELRTIDQVFPYSSRCVIFHLADDFLEMLVDPEYRGEGFDMNHYRDYLIAQRGQPMRRAIIKAEERYQKQIPARIRLSKIHSGYRRKR